MEEPEHYQASGEIEDKQAWNGVTDSPERAQSNEVHKIWRHATDNDGGEDEPRAAERKCGSGVGQREGHFDIMA